MGRILGESISDYIEMINEEVNSKEERKLKLISLKTVKNTRTQSKKNSEKISVNKFQTRIITNSANKEKFTEDVNDKRDETMLSKKARDLIDSIKEDEKKFEQEKKEKGHESD